MIFKISCESCLISLQYHLRDGVLACVGKREVSRGSSEILKYFQHLPGKD